MRDLRLRLFVSLGGMCALLLLGMLFSTPYATAPTTAQQIFVTATPAPPDLLDNTPADDVLLGQYALRLWQEEQLVNLLITQINRLSDGERIPTTALQMTQYELEHRFPGAPRTQPLREALLSAMVEAPRGSVDMRGVVRPFVVEQLNADMISASTPNTLNVLGFSVETQPVDLNGDETSDLYAQIRYPANAIDPADLLYDDHLLIYNDPETGYVLPDYTADLPAAPFNAVETIALWRLEDLNGDGRDEMGVLVDRGAINQELLIYGWRSDEVISLVLPDETIFIGASVNTSGTPATIETAVYQVESSRWQCFSTIDVTWNWDANFFRPSVPLNAQPTNTDTIGCDLYENEPLFIIRPDQGIQLLSGLIADTADQTERGYDRANIALAVMFLLNGQPRSASQQLEMVMPLMAGNEWLTGQVETFTRNTEGDDPATPLEVCAALMRDNDDAACVVDQLLQLTFIQTPLVLTIDVVEQLESLGLPVLDVVELREVGRLDRTAINFNLTGASWWAFAPTDPNFFVPEIIDPPEGFGDAIFPLGLIEVPQAALNALFINRDPRAALTVLENVVRNNPDVPLSTEARYFEAFCFDMLADRTNAREAYFAIWTEFPTTHYGQLAGAHLEGRG